jgi:hypothetical protein
MSGRAGLCCTDARNRPRETLQPVWPVGASAPAHPMRPRSPSKTPNISDRLRTSSRVAIGTSPHLENSPDCGQRPSFLAFLFCRGCRGIVLAGVRLEPRLDRSCRRRCSVYRRRVQSGSRRWQQRLRRAGRFRRIRSGGHTRDRRRSHTHWLSFAHLGQPVSVRSLGRCHGQSRTARGRADDTLLERCRLRYQSLQQGSQPARVHVDDTQRERLGPGSLSEHQCARARVLEWPHLAAHRLFGLQRSRNPRMRDRRLRWLSAMQHRRGWPASRDPRRDYAGPGERSTWDRLLRCERHRRLECPGLDHADSGDPRPHGLERPVLLREPRL